MEIPVLLVEGMVQEDGVVAVAPADREIQDPVVMVDLVATVNHFLHLRHLWLNFFYQHPTVLLLLLLLVQQDFMVEVVEVVIGVMELPQQEVLVEEVEVVMELVAVDHQSLLYLALYTPVEVEVEQVQGNLLGVGLEEMVLLS